MLVTTVATATITALWELVRRPVLLGLAVLGFVVGGVTALVVSAQTNGWWQDFWLNVGVNMVFVGAVDLLILGVIQRLMAAPESRTQIGNLSLSIPPDQLASVLSALEANRPRGTNDE